MESFEIPDVAPKRPPGAFLMIAGSTFDVYDGFDAVMERLGENDDPSELLTFEQVVTFDHTGESYGRRLCLRRGLILGAQEWTSGLDLARDRDREKHQNECLTTRSGSLRIQEVDWSELPSFMRGAPRKPPPKDEGAEGKGDE